MKLSNRIIAFVIGVAVLYFIYAFMLDIIGYVVAAWVLSMMGKPIMTFFLEKLKLKKLKIGKGLSAVFVLIIYILFTLLFFIIILPPIVSKIDNLTQIDYENVFAPLNEPIEQFKAYLVRNNLVDQENINSNIVKDFFNNIFNINQIPEAFSSIFNFAGNVLIAIFSIGFITFFFLKESLMFNDIVTSFVSEKHVDKTVEIIEEISFLLRRYFGGIAMQITILFAFVFIVLSVFGIKDALLIAFFAAIINVIPYIGPIIGASFGVFIVFTNNISMDFYDVILTKVIIIVATFAAMQTIDNYILQPLIYSDKIKAHPLEIFVVILLGAKIYGILGMVLAIPAYIVLRAVAKVFFSNYRAIRKITRVS